MQSPESHWTNNFKDLIDYDRWILNKFGEKLYHGSIIESPADNSRVIIDIEYIKDTFVQLHLIGIVGADSSPLMLSNSALKKACGARSWICSLLLDKDKRSQLIYKPQIIKQSNKIINNYELY